MTSILKVTEIQDPTNSNTALTIDSSGRVSTPVKPFAFVSFPNTGTYVTKTANAIIDFSVAVVMMEIIMTLLHINLLAQ